MKFLFPTTLAALLFAVLFTGCTTLDRIDSAATEQVLVAAGFQTRLADTPQRRAQLQALTPYRIQPKSTNGRLIYIYPDPGRGYALIGGPRQYQKYQQLSLQQEVAEDQMAAASEMQMLSLDGYSAWSPFW